MRRHGSIVLIFTLFAGCGGGTAPVQTSAPPPSQPPALTITSSAPPAGSTGSSYAGSGFSLIASGGTAPYSWSWIAAQGSSLPSGLDLSPTGLISGTPQVASAYNVVVTVSDSSNPSAQVTANYAIAIAGTPVLAITSGAPPDGTVGVDYGPTITQTFSCYWSPILGWHEVCTPCSSQSSCSSLPRCTGFSVKPCQETKNIFEGFTFTAAGGVSPYGWSASGMPPGIDVDPSSGEILGTPTAAGSYSIMITAMDASSPPAQVSATYVIDITTSGGMCVGKGMQCYANHPSCAGLQVRAGIDTRFLPIKMCSVK